MWSEKPLELLGYLLQFRQRGQEARTAGSRLARRAGRGCIPCHGGIQASEGPGRAGSDSDHAAGRLPDMRTGDPGPTVRSRERARRRETGDAGGR
jgi:hypothetical protein